ncbi:MAG TPA: GntR family transcriptional regulator [Pseudolysinimonas sp.]|nr:GntR family transcriptional regulator [Pseudolysinimonas sp.]
MPMTDSAEYLEQPLLTSPGQPLRVAVYSRISRGIRTGILPAGELLPRETELCVSLGVSRTVVREALMLLEEDGLITTRRGVGRFVAESPPAEGLDDFQPLENLFLQGGDRLDVRVLEFSKQATTDFVSDLLGLDAAAEFWFRESVIVRDGQPAALVQEYMPVERYLAPISEPVAREFADAAREESTLLRALTGRVGGVFTAGICRITPSLAGPTRAAHLDIKPGDPLLVLTQTAEIGGVPAYISKSAIPPAFAHLSVTQWNLTSGV